jgi:hypothetical protein
LSIVAVLSFGAILHVMQLLYASNPFLTADAKTPARPARLAERQRTDAPADSTFWPHFPGGGEGVFHRMKINGVDTISEDWQTGAPAADVIGYYREQMLARGWRDATEEDYQLQPETRGPGIGINGLQNPDYVQNYGAMMESSVILNRGQWSLQVMAVPGEKGIRQTNVRVFAAETPSIKDFYLSVGAGAFENGGAGAPDGAIDTVQESGGQRCHTTVAVRNEEPRRVFSDMLRTYEENKWKYTIFHPVQQGRTGYYALLVKGESYAALSVRALAEGASSSVTLTEVSPEAGP